MLRPSDPLGVAEVLPPARVWGAHGAAWRGAPARRVVARLGEVTPPPLLFRRALFGELLAWSGEGCGKTVVQGHRDEALFLDWPAEVLADVDTPEDFAAATARLNPR